MSEEQTLTNDSNEVKFVVVPSRRKTVRKAKVTLEGKLNLYNSAFIAESISNLADQYDLLDFKLENIAEIDLSAIQTMYYYKSVFGGPEKSISFQLTDLPGEVGAIINKCKYNKILFKKPATGLQ